MPKYEIACRGCGSSNVSAERKAFVMQPIKLSAPERNKVTELEPLTVEHVSFDDGAALYVCGDCGDTDEEPGSFIRDEDDEPHGAGADPYGRPSPLTHPEFWTE